jgi:exodeoxyribonuclease V alpha subunit
VTAHADPFDARRARAAAGVLRAFNDAGVLAAADVHVARRLAQLAGERDEHVALAAALAVRGPRLGHVRVDLASIRDTATAEGEEAVDVSALPWPEPAEWPARLAASALVALGEDDDGAALRPLRLVGTALYLDRYWREERRLAADLRALSDGDPPDVAVDVLAGGLVRLFPGETAGRQCLAAAAAVLRRLAVVAGGPGTGKTTTVARIVALLAEQGAAPPLVALAAPTGRAAARLEEAVHAEAAGLDVGEEARAGLLALRASTLHRLLGARPGRPSRHHRGNRLPHDVVVVDETSMVSLPFMARLVEAVRPDARLVLVGDPGQLASIEAGAVLADIVGPTTAGLRMTAAARAGRRAATGHDVPAAPPPAGVSVGDGIVALDRVHRFGGGIARVAGAIRTGDGDAAVAALRAAPGEVAWLALDAADPAAQPALAPVRDGVVAGGRAVLAAARRGDGQAAIAALAAYRVLCAHREGPYGVGSWTGRIEAWLGEAVEGFRAGGEWYVGRPLLVTANDHGLRLYNGDTGVVVATPAGGATAAFERGGRVLAVSPARLAAVETAYAMTVHKSQGSQYAAAAVVLPAPGSQILTRELLYTAVTRARERLVLVGTEETVRAAIARPVARASGLRARLWGAEGG